MSTETCPEAEQIPLDSLLCCYCDQPLRGNPFGFAPPGGWEVQLVAGDEPIAYHVECRKIAPFLEGWRREQEARSAAEQLAAELAERHPESAAEIRRLLSLGRGIPQP